MNFIEKQWHLNNSDVRIIKRVKLVLEEKIQA